MTDSEAGWYLTFAVAMSGVPARSLAALNALRCQVFGTSYNPNNIRTGAKYLKKSLVGSSMLNY